MLFEYASVAAFFLVAIVFVFGAMVVGYFIRPNRMYSQKLQTYECGEKPVGQAWFNFNPRFYIIALVYLVFDIAVAFIYPVARVFKQWVSQGLGLVALVELLLFVAVCLVGLAYVWVKGDLDWIRTMRFNDGDCDDGVEGADGADDGKIAFGAGDSLKRELIQASYVTSEASQNAGASTNERDVRQDKPADVGTDASCMATC